MQSACAVLYCRLWPVWLYTVICGLSDSTLSSVACLTLHCHLWPVWLYTVICGLSGSTLSSVACLTLHCHLRPVWLYNIFPTQSHKQHDFQKTFWTIKSVCWSSLQLLTEIFLTLGRIPRDIISVHRYFHENPSSGSQVCYMRTKVRAGGQTDMMKLTVAFRNFAKSVSNDLNTLFSRVWINSDNTVFYN